MLTRSDVAFDSHRNPSREALSAGGTAYALTERSFDDRGQLACEAQRMNPAGFGATTDACTRALLRAGAADVDVLVFARVVAAARTPI